MSIVLNILQYQLRDCAMRQDSTVILYIYIHIYSTYLTSTYTLGRSVYRSPRCSLCFLHNVSASLRFCPLLLHSFSLSQIAGRFVHLCPCSTTLALAGCAWMVDNCWVAKTIWRSDVADSGRGSDKQVDGLWLDSVS